MPEWSLNELYALFEQCLDHAPEERRARACELCKNNPRRLKALLDLIDRDKRFDQPRSTTEAGLGRLTQLAMSERYFKGQIIGSFRIEECIGSGGMGTVYRVSRVDGQVEQQAALKLIDPGRLNRSLLSRFSNERRVLASLEHPGICRFLDAGTFAQDQPYVLMELIDGEPILGYCNRKRLNLKQRVEIFLKVVDAVAHAHRRLVIHRDLKSGNILINQDGQPKLLDFGIAKNLAVDPEWEQTQTGERFFTPRGAAPEQVLGQPVSVACDIYALGQLLYQLLCGQPPFEFSGLRSGEVEGLILTQLPQPMAQRSLANDRGTLASLGCRSHRELRRQLRGDLDTIVMKCLRKEPEQRYLSTEQMQADLHRWLAGRPIKSRRNERGYRLRKFVARNQLAVSLTSLLMVTLLGSSIVMAWQSANMAQERARALLERDRAQHAVRVLQQAFESADPTGTLGADVKAREILKAARTPIFALRDSQPELFVSLATVLSEVELSLRMTESAAEWAEPALEAAQEIHSSREQIRPLLLIKARALTNSRRREEAAMVLKQIALMDDHARPDRLHAQGRWHLLGDERDQAIELFERARNLHSQNQVPFEDRLDLTLDLATALSQRGSHGTSLSLYDNTLREIESRWGPDHALAILTRLGKIEALVRADRLERAENEAMMINDQVERLYGPRSSWAGRLHGTLGMLHLRRYDAESAAEHYSRALDIWQEHFSPDHPDIARVSINLAFALQHFEEGEARAEALYRELLASLDEYSTPNNQTALTVRGLLSQMLVTQDRRAEAMQELVGNSEIDERAAIEVPHWRNAFLAALSSADCHEVAHTDQLLAKCRRAAIRLDRTRNSGAE